jgi:hypothetical protein
MARLKAGLPILVNGKCGIKAMGDDSIEVSFPQILDEMVKLGHKIGENAIQTTVAGTEFCSSVWREDGFAEPVHPAKTVFRFLSRPEKDDNYLELWGQLSYHIRYQNHPLKELIRELCEGRVDRSIKEKENL